MSCDDTKSMVTDAALSNENVKYRAYALWRPCDWHHVDDQLLCTMPLPSSASVQPSPTGVRPAEGRSAKPCPHVLSAPVVPRSSALVLR